MTTPQPELTRTIQLLAEINRLHLKAFKAKSIQTLIFIILNDTVPIVRYDRAVLWKLKPKGEGSPELLGVSGQSQVKKSSDLSRFWVDTIKQLKNIDKPQLISDPNIPPDHSVLWLPIFSYEKLALGLWLERWNGEKWSPHDIELLGFLMQGYGAAWERLTKRFTFKVLTEKPVPAVLLGVLFLTMFLRIPLRVVAPCEVVPKDPTVITAPLEGIIEKIMVQPGDAVKKGDILFEYDKRVPLQELRVEQKKVEIIKSEVDRATAQSYKDKKALNELAIQALKLQKEQLELELAEYRASQLNVKAPSDGIAMFENPDEWHGKPVRIGEKVMVLSDAFKTKVRMWIPEEDNIIIDINKPIKVFLNVHPATSIPAKIIYVSNYTSVTEKAVTSFVAEADWINEQQHDVKLGLKGTAILYGENVSVFYWIIRKPWAYVRRYIGF